MIRVSKPPAPPKLNSGTELTRKDCEAYAAHCDSYQDGSKTFEFNQNIYGHKSVKNALRNSHHGKCCFCEGIFTAFASGDVEHYRPKGAVRQDKQSARLKPGYYWLVYTWENLYWCCQVCNRTYKKDLFPLRDPSNRARSHDEDIGQEDPLILDPGVADPRDHIKFKNELAIGITDVGKTTVEVVGLNRNDLMEERRRYLKVLKHLMQIVKISECQGTAVHEEESASARSELEEAVAPESKFSAMATDCLSGALV